VRIPVNSWCGRRAPAPDEIVKTSAGNADVSSTDLMHADNDVCSLHGWAKPSGLPLRLGVL